MMPNMLSSVEEEQDPFEVFPPHVDTSGISTANDLGGSPPPGGKCLVLKAFAELQNAGPDRQEAGAEGGYISDKPIMLPPFVEPSHCMAYQLTRRGRAQADRVVSVLGYACPDITYSPALYPITALLLHFMSGKESLYLYST
uniref:Uncharacterized protein n=1 Tax=Timema genevievae TaxID=629358 RepID=A0A7R9JTQ6_TIMGE|nr:unnamed protein product [Timema genevievae]